MCYTAKRDYLTQSNIFMRIIVNGSKCYTRALFLCRLVRRSVLFRNNARERLETAFLVSYNTLLSLRVRLFECIQITHRYIVVVRYYKTRLVEKLILQNRLRPSEFV